MKIGEFSASFGLTIDTIRHYMDLGLVFPEKKGSQFEFDHNCERDIQDVLSLKELGFSLGEIKTVMMYQRLGRFSNYQHDDYFLSIYKSKLKSVEEEINKLNGISDNIKNALENMRIIEDSDVTYMGVDLKILHLLKCPHCGSELELEEGTIKSSQVSYGTLKCSCGVNYDIDDGIIVSRENVQEDSGMTYYDYISEYIVTTDSEYLDKIYKSMEWIDRRLDYQSLDNSQILELGSGIGFFLRTIYSKLPDDCVYIAVDHDISRMRFLKKMLQGVESKKNVIFIATDFLDIPVGKKSIDFLVDMSGSSNYGFEHQEFLLDYTDNLVKDNSRMIGTYILFKKFSFGSIIEERFRHNFDFETIKKNISELGYVAIDDAVSEELTKGGKYESYFVEGEKVFNYIFYGKR